MPELTNKTNALIKSTMGYHFAPGRPARVPMDVYKSFLNDPYMAGVLKRKDLMVTNGDDLLAEAKEIEDKAAAEAKTKAVRSSMVAPEKKVANVETPEEKTRRVIADADKSGLRAMCRDSQIFTKVDGKQMDEPALRAALLDFHFPATVKATAKGRGSSKESNLKG